MSHPKDRHISGWEVYNSPEFKALCKRFGIAVELPTHTLVLTLTEEELIVDQRYKPIYPIQVDPDQVVDTTNLHNQEYRTKVPARNRGDLGE